VGVTDRERRRRQKLLLSVEIKPNPRKDIADSIENTINYSAVRSGIRALLQEERYNLIETIAQAVAHYVLTNFEARQVEITVKKFPYRDTAWVGYRLSLGKSDEIPH
jgi:dihydroneopterin aldolase